MNWVSVDERLPERECRVLAWHVDADGKAPGWPTDADYYHDEQRIEPAYEGTRVTHWMPLPTPPGESP